MGYLVVLLHLAQYMSQNFAPMYGFSGFRLFDLLHRAQDMSQNFAPIYGFSGFRL